MLFLREVVESTLTVAPTVGWPMTPTAS